MADRLFPGAPRAVARGCTCGMVKNNFGKGLPSDAGRIFHLHRYCPVHGVDWRAARRTARKTGRRK